jgi:hypothetical protein
MNEDTRLRGGRLRSDTTAQTATPDNDAPEATTPGTAPVVAAERSASSDTQTTRKTSTSRKGRTTTPTGTTAPVDDATDQPTRTAPVAAPAATQPMAAGRPVARRPLMRIPGFSPSAPIIGWLTAWGAAALAWSCLTAAGVSLGLGLGLADGRGVVEDRAWPGIWLLVIQVGAFVIGGFAAARLARGNGMFHAVLAWVVAMLATGADAIIQTFRDSGHSPLGQIGIPFWVETGLKSNGWLALALAIFALGSLLGAVIGGMLGSAANRAAVRHVDEPALAGRY